MATKDTRARLLRAAAELIGEVGWAAVSTRAIAERAGLPHGTVSYHFTGKAELLREAALTAVTEFFTRPAQDLVQEANDVHDVIASSAGLTELDHAQLVLFAEALLHATRDDELRRSLARQVRRYRLALTERITKDMRTGAVVQGLDPEGVALVVSATLDGLILHSTADTDVDVELGCRTLAALLDPRRRP